MRYFKILIILAWAGAASPATPVHAQSNPPFQNPALDSNCYFPQIGVPGEIDTIYGHAQETIGSTTYGNGLGAYIHNLGPKPNGTPGNMLIENEGASIVFEQTPTGSNFNLHNLHAVVQNFELDRQYIRYGHFHDQQHLDLFDEDAWVIYWADDSGNYDSSRYTKLKSNISGSLGYVGGSTDQGILTHTYITHLTSDTIDDIVLGLWTSDSTSSKDSLYLELFTGGNDIDTSKIVFEDTSIVMPPPYLNDNHVTMQGDFHGTGRDDLLIADKSNDLFLYQNDPPFTLANLLLSMFYDTLWVRPQQLDATVNGYFTFNKTLAMHAIPKSKGDSSYDWLVWIPTNDDTANGVYIFRGGPDFGSHRITLDSAAYVILPPTALGETNWPDEIIDAGDMTGTGNHVLYVEADDGVVAYQNFYVTGQALDNKIDVYNTFGAGAGGDTLTANGDSLGDFLMGFPTYTTPNDISNGLQDVGSMWLMYGSKNIPVHLNPQFADVVNTQQQNGAGITFSPNPVTQSWSVATIVWPVSEDAEYSIYDMLGRKLDHGPIQLYGGAEQQRIYFTGMSAGVYIYTIEGAHGSASARFVKLGGASGSSGTSQPSIIQQMKGDRDGKADPAEITFPPAIR